MALFRCLACGDVMGFERTAQHDNECQTKLPPPSPECGCAFCQSRWPKKSLADDPKWTASVAKAHRLIDKPTEQPKENKS